MTTSTAAPTTITLNSNSALQHAAGDYFEAYLLACERHTTGPYRHVAIESDQSVRRALEAFRKLACELTPEIDLEKMDLATSVRMHQPAENALNAYLGEVGKRWGLGNHKAFTDAARAH